MAQAKRGRDGQNYRGYRKTLTPTARSAKKRQTRSKLFSDAFFVFIFKQKNAAILPVTPDFFAIQNVAKKLFFILFVDFLAVEPFYGFGRKMLYDLAVPQVEGVDFRHFGVA